MRPRFLSRREFVTLGAAAAGAVLVSRWWPWARSVQADTTAPAASELPTRPLGNTGVPVTILGLGGEGVLRTWGRRDEAVAVIRRALDAGITYCDTAPAYSGSQDYYGEVLAEYRQRLFLASKTHIRSRDGSLRLLEDSLRRLRTDHLDLWQLHDLRTVGELEAIFGNGGAIHALEQARREGMVRFVGITGHYDPAVLVEAMRRYPFDTVLVALNAADPHRLSFIEEALPTATKQGLGVIGMKVLGRGRLLDPDVGLSAAEALGYVLSLPISSAIIGFSSPAEVDAAVEVARRFTPMPAETMARLEARTAPYADDLCWFKRT